MKNLSFRIISAIIALITLFLAVYFGQEKGIYILALLVVIRGSFEIARMFFNSDYPAFLKRIFVFVSTLVFLSITQMPLQIFSGLAIILSFVLVTSIGIVFHKSFKNLDLILAFISKFCLGLVYTCFLPASVVWMTQSNNGIEWFLCLLSVVLAGDIGAYIFGVNFGKNKIAPLLSPNKSLEGCVGGLLFSMAAAAAFQILLPNTPVMVLLICGLVGGILGQIGDFFESLIKRVSGVKDSGSIMPGHGGILDRLDGVLLAAPLFYLAATYFSL